MSAQTLSIELKYFPLSEWKIILGRQGAAYCATRANVQRSVALLLYVLHNAHKISSCSIADVAKRPSWGNVPSSQPIAAEPHCHHRRFQSFGREGFSLSPNMRKKHDSLSVGLFPSAHAQLQRQPVAVFRSSRSVPPAVRARPFYSAPLLSFVSFSPISVL